MITSTKRYVPVATLSINDKITFLGDLEQGFKIIISWNKFRSDLKSHSKKQEARLYDWSKT